MSNFIDKSHEYKINWDTLKYWTSHTICLRNVFTKEHTLELNLLSSHSRSRNKFDFFKIDFMNGAASYTLEFQKIMVSPEMTHSSIIV